MEPKTEQFVRIVKWLILAAALLAPMAGPLAARDNISQPPDARIAPIAMLVDARSGQVLHQRNPDRRFVPASLTKTMTALLIFDLIDAGKLSPRTRFTIRPQTFQRWHARGSRMFLRAGQSVALRDLLSGLMTVSANDGAIVLAEGIAGSTGKWVAMMNARARQLGMRNSHFNTPNGWPDDGKTFVSARDLIRLGREMVLRHPALFRQYIGKHQFTFNRITQFNHDPLSGLFKGADGIKTGFTNEAGYGYLGTIKRGKTRLLMVIAGAPSEAERARAARAYAEWGLEHFTYHPLFAAGEEIARARVQAGSRRSVGLSTGNSLELAWPRGSHAKPRLTLRYDGPLRAPIKKGQEVAMLGIRIDGMPPSQIPLSATSSVAPAGFFDRLWNAAAQWLS